MNPIRLDEQRQDELPEPIYNSSVPIQDVTLKTYRERWMRETGRKKGSGKSVPVVRYDDDDNDLKFQKYSLKFSLSLYIYIYIYEVVLKIDILGSEKLFAAL